MQLTEIGLNDWFETQAHELFAHGESLARVTAVDRDQYLVRNETAELPAELTGRFA